MSLPKRKQNRLSGYDYSSCGAYFITVCTKDKKKLFWSDVGAAIGRPADGEYSLSEYGLIVDEAIKNIEKIYPMISVDSYVVMPNHVHMIIMINNDEYGRPMAAPYDINRNKSDEGICNKANRFSCLAEIISRPYYKRTV